MSYEITRRLEIDAGHRLLKHESKCAHVHGHRYAFEFTMQAERLDGVGRVIDFSAVKQHVGGWLDHHWDHAMLVQEGDPLIEWLRQHNQKHAVLQLPPTAENLSLLMLAKASELLRTHGISVVRVRCYETPNCWADAVPEEVTK